MGRKQFQTDADPVELGLAIKRGFEKTIASRDRPAPVDPGYLIGVAVWWVVAFAGLSIAGMSWLPAAMLSALLCGFWPVFLLFDRKSYD